MTLVTIKENSWLAKMAAYRLKSKKVAMVVGQTIYLYNTTKEDFLRNPKWLRHEVAHVKQFAQYGFFKFIFLYLFETFNKGYQYNKYELEAKKKETDNTILSGIEVI
jgi:hypothetical protein